MFEKIMLASMFIFIVWYVAKILFPDDSGYKLDATDIPDVVKKGKVWSKEVKIFDKKSGYVSIPDLVIKNENKLHVGELKSRNIAKPYKSDVIQMSVAKVTLEGNGNVVSENGLLKVSTPKEAKWFEVKLLNKNEIDLLRIKYFKLKNGVEIGEKCSIKKICERCEYNDVC